MLPPSHSPLHSDLPNPVAASPSRPAPLTRRERRDAERAALHAEGDATQPHVRTKHNPAGAAPPRAARKARTQRHPRPARRPADSRAHWSASFVAGTLLIVGITLFTTSTPANAVSVEESTTTTAPTSTIVPAPKLDLQALTVTGSATTPVARDGFTVGAVPAPPEPEPEPELAIAGLGSGGLQWPVPHDTFSDYFGPRSAPCGGCSTYHDGVDITPGEGTPILAMYEGVVVATSSYDDGGLGVHAIIEHQIDGQTVRSTYGHMTEGSLLVAVGEVVGVGQMLGNVGNTGQSTGPHLHFEIYVDGVATDPIAWMASHGL